MRISRRDLLKGTVAAGALTAVGTADAREKPPARPDAVGMLFDSTRCIGCRACQTACREANKLPADRAAGPDGALYDAPLDLNGTTKNIVKEYVDGDRQAFVKVQCMQCLDPSCVSACMLGALHKEGEGTRRIAGERAGTGIVVWDRTTCLGCRYCQIACPFNVPKFEWLAAFPYIVKCELCRHRADPTKQGPLAVANPACCEVCPRQAIVYGRRDALLVEAKRRIAAEPARYNPAVYGEKEGGGTAVLYLAAAGVTFEQLGFPALPERSAAELSESVSHAPYVHGAAPVALYAILAVVVRRNRRRQERARAEEAKR